VKGVFESKNRILKGHHACQSSLYTPEERANVDLGAFPPDLITGSDEALLSGLLNFPKRGCGGGGTFEEDRPPVEGVGVSRIESSPLVAIVRPTTLTVSVSFDLVLPRTLVLRVAAAALEGVLAGDIVRFRLLSFIVDPNAPPLPPLGRLCFLGALPGNGGYISNLVGGMSKEASYSDSSSSESSGRDEGELGESSSCPSLMIYGDFPLFCGVWLGVLDARVTRAGTSGWSSIGTSSVAGADG